MLVDIWNRPQQLSEMAKNGWEHFAFSGEVLSRDKYFQRLFELIIFLSCIAFLLGRLGITGLFFTQILLPIYLCGIPVILWLGAKAAETGTDFEKPRRFYWKIFVITALTLAPPFLFPLLMGDAGSVYASLAAFIPLAFILGKRCGGSRLFVIFPIASVGLLIFAFVFLVNSNRLLTWLPPSVAPRILAFKQGSNFQHQLLASDAGSGSNDIGLDASDITQTYEHLWENQAMAHEGGWLGFGFGEAPSRLSQVRQDTIQYDSVFSFFIVGDYGLLGGIFLLLMYAVPLVLVFLAGRERCDAGCALAMVIASAFLIEGLTHAAMNLWVVPLTGRNVPLLSVHSFTGDLLRWLIFFAFAVSAMFWRYDEDGKYSDEAVSVFSNDRPDAPVYAVESDEQQTKAQWFFQQAKNFFFKSKEVWQQALLLFIFPALFFLSIVYAGVWTLHHSELSVFDWHLVKEDIDGAADLGIIRAEQQEGKVEECPKIILDEKNYPLKWANSNPQTTFLAQQINRFNALSCEERIGRGTNDSIISDLKMVKDFGDYQNFLNGLRRSDDPARPPRKPFLLSVERVGDTEATDRGALFVVRFNPAFNIRRSFHIGEAKEKTPEVGFAGGEKLLGAAWVKGKWTTAFNPNARLLSWTEWMASAMNLEWGRLGNKDAARVYKEISLDQKLQTAALAFIDRKGIELHKQTVGGSKWNEKLPPRIGLTVLQLSGKADNGATLALGSFPRAASGSRWQQVCYEGQDCLWLPPAQLVEKKFPSFLRQLYGGDRNFENAAVMGSTTKPIWASAVLATHPKLNLEKDFKVSGSAVDDTDVFGIKITDKAWTGHGSGGAWVDFDRFLTESNNRYQVLFGFLGLAQSDGKEILTEPHFANGADSVMLKNQVWRKTPRFAENIAFGPSNPQKIEHLEDTELAKRLRAMYGAGTFRGATAGGEQTEDYSYYLNSFWTKDENDDLPRAAETSAKTSKAPDAFPPTILPARVNLKLNRIHEPRDFVAWLLGGGENRWSNVQFAAAFASSVTGKPILPHIVKNEINPIFVGRDETFTAIAKKLRPGLKNVVFAANGTARANLSREALNILDALEGSGFEIYAKTGTLETFGASGNTTRLVLAVVQFEDADQTKVKNGLVFSIFAQQTERGTATSWLGEFLVQNRQDIYRLLGYSGNQSAAPAVKQPPRIQKR